LPILLELGLAYFDAGDLDGAARAYQSALDSGGDSSAIADTLRRHPEVSRLLFPR
jgi:hypothetical protein